MGFELFTRKRTHGGPPAVTVTKYGMFIINGSAIEKHFKGIEYVHVYWDKDKRKVGIKPLSKRQDKSYRVNLSPKGNVGSLSASSFLKFVGYDFKETNAFPANWNVQEGLMEFALPDAKKAGKMKITDE